MSENYGTKGNLVQLQPRHRSDAASVDQDRADKSLGLRSNHVPANSALSTQHSALPLWRSLEELADSTEFQEFLHREFPENASEWNDQPGRRTFLKLMGASIALAGLTACTRQPTEHIAPYVRQPEQIVPGRPLFFATAMPLAGFGTGVLAESHEGRPTKIEGNKDHPASLGATDVFSQASVLGLYDPDRSQTLTYLGEIVTWSSFLGAIRPAIEAQRAIGSAPGGKPTLRLLSGTITSPTLAYQIRSLLTLVPGAKWHQYQPAGRNSTREGSKLAFGEYANVVYKFDQADVVLSLDSDFLASGPGHLRYAHDFAARKRVLDAERGRDPNRLYVVESTISSTGSVADHREPVGAGMVETFARAVAARIGVAGLGQAAAPSGLERLVDAVTADLRKSRGRGIVIAGEPQPPIVHALAHAMNETLGNAGSTVIYTDPVEASPVEEIGSLAELVRDMDAGQVELLLILGGNPVYEAPADFAFTQRLQKVPLRIHLSLYNDETSQLCHWHIPESHYLESWGDVRAFDGTVSVIQPLIAPLYQGCRTAHEVLSAMLGEPERKPYDIVRDYWQRRTSSGGQEPPVKQPGTPSPAPSQPSPEFERFWRKSVHDGVVAGTTLPAKTLKTTTNWSTQPIGAQPPPSQGSYEIVFRPDPTVFDGHFANNGWLQELPKPILRTTWDNAVLISPGTAAALGIGQSADGIAVNKVGRIGGEIIADKVELQYGDTLLTAPAFIVPGHPDKTVTLHLGYGRTSAGRVGTNAGFNFYRLRTSNAQWNAAGVSIRKASGEYIIATTQLHHAIDESVVGKRELIRSGTLADFRRDPKLSFEPEDSKHEESSDKENNGHGEEHHPSLYPDYEYKDYAWGMAIDLNSCIGCSACVVACVAENNIAVVGKEQVLRSREMHWLRIDSYYRGNERNPETYFQPVLCQQCENAPCEVVCPVAATSHSAEGLNDMVYNRCVGTRYCSNNCPYKVRRFNFLLYQDFYTASLKMMRNPDVSVRSRGVMEKCTYCVQRIQSAKLTAEKQNRRVRDGEITTACEAACPTQAITFGDINDHGSRVAKLKELERNFSLLGELNTKPRTTYLGVVRNPNPELEKA